MKKSTKVHIAEVLIWFVIISDFDSLISAAGLLWALAFVAVVVLGFSWFTNGSWTEKVARDALKTAKAKWAEARKAKADKAKWTEALKTAKAKWAEALKTAKVKWAEARKAKEVKASKADKTPTAQAAEPVEPAKGEEAAGAYVTGPFNIDPSVLNAN